MDVSSSIRLFVSNSVGLGVMLEVGERFSALSLEGHDMTFYLPEAVLVTVPATTLDESLPDLCFLNPTPTPTPTAVPTRTVAMIAVTMMRIRDDKVRDMGLADPLLTVGLLISSMSKASGGVSL